MFDQRGGVVEISTDGRTVWVNVDNKCVARITEPNMVQIEHSGRTLLKMGFIPSQKEKEDDKT